MNIKWGTLSRRERWIVAGLLLTILAASGVVAAKVQWRSFALGKLAWQERVERFAGEALDKEQVAKYRTSTNPVKKKPHPAKASFTVMPADGYVKQVGDSVGATFGGTLAVMNLDGFAGYEWSNSAGIVVVSAASAGGSVVISDVAHAPAIGGQGGFPLPDGWPVAATAAWEAWVAFVEDPDNLSDGSVFLLKAEASAGVNSDYEYFVVGWGRFGGFEQPAEWIGPTEWVLPFQLSITNCFPYVKTADKTYTRRMSPRKPQDRSAGYILMADGDTVMTATLGGASASGTVTPDMPDPEATDVTIIGGHLAGLHCSIAYAVAPEVNTSYGEIRDISMAGDVPINLHCNFWNDSADGTNGDDWYASEETPTAPHVPVWRYFNDGSTFKLHEVGAGAQASCATGSGAYGPFRFNIMAGRGGYGNAVPDGAGGYENAFPIAAEFDVGLQRYINETELETVYLGPGLSDWYSVSYTCIELRPSVALRKGTYQVGLEPSFYVKARESWLISSGELLDVEVDAEGGTQPFACDNRYGYIALPAVNADMSSGYWGPAITYVHTDISADIPPGFEARPTLWTAGANVTVDGSNNAKWTVAGGTGTVTRTLASRKPLRFAYMASYDYTGEPVNPDWPMINLANFWGSGDTAAMIAAVPVEDVTNYDNSRIAALSFLTTGVATPPPEIDWNQVTLRLTYSHWDFIDVRWNLDYGSTHRFGVDSDFPEGINQSTASFDFTGQNVYDENGAQIAGVGHFDLAQLRRTNTIHLQNVSSVQIIGLPEGEYTLSDWRLIKDPNNHGAVDEEGQSTYPGMVAQQSTMPWNWAKCKTGFGSTFEGMPHLNLINGTEAGDSPLTGDVQAGITGMEFRQYNPEWLATLEEPPTQDPTYARILQRLQDVLQMQEQLTGCTLETATIAAATGDGEDTLGLLYMWDLERESSDDTNGNAAFTVGQINIAPYGIPHIKHTVNCYWTTHGRAQGMAYQNHRFIRGAGVSSDTTTDGQALFYRRPVDSEGAATGEWEACGSMTPDVTGRWISPPARESGYEYGTKMAAGDTSPTSVTSLVTREYADLIAWFVTTVGRSLDHFTEIDGTLHVALVSSDDTLLEKIIQSNYTSQSLTISSQTPCSTPNIWCSSDNNYHCIWEYSDKIYYSRRTGQSWSTAVELFSGNYPSVAVNSIENSIDIIYLKTVDGTKHVYSRHGSPSSGTYQLGTERLLPSWPSQVVPDQRIAAVYTQPFNHPSYQNTRSLRIGLLMVNQPSTSDPENTIWESHSDNNLNRLQSDRVYIPDLPTTLEGLDAVSALHDQSYHIVYQDPTTSKFMFLSTLASGVGTITSRVPKIVSNDTPVTQVPRLDIVPNQTTLRIVYSEEDELTILDSRDNGNTWRKTASGI